MEMSDTQQPSHDITRLLVDLRQGNRAALDALTPLVYKELRKLAARYLADERQAATFQPTALVHEAYIRLVNQTLPDFEGRAHFFGVASQLMRQILVDHARRTRSQKRGSGVVKAEINDALDAAQERPGDIVALDDALSALAKLDDRKAKVIELRYFGGMSAEEISTSLGISTATITRDLRLAEAWLAKQLKNE